ncbi:MAG: hypothetical protein ABIG20_01525 [archaeon]
MTKKGKSRKFKKLKKPGGMCGLILVIILVVSGLAYIIPYLTGETAEPQEDAGIQVRASVSFSDYEVVTEIVNLTDGQTAEDAFNKIAVVDQKITDIGTLEIRSVSAQGYSATNNETHIWVFYTNGGLNFKEPGEYAVQYGESLELRYEENPY